MNRVGMFHSCFKPRQLHLRKNLKDSDKKEHPCKESRLESFLSDSACLGLLNTTYFHRFPLLLS